MSIPNNNPKSSQILATDTKIYNYYQQILPEADFSHFFEDFSKELPAVFRIQKQFRSVLYQQRFSELMEPLFAATTLEKLDMPPFAYQIDISRRELRSNEALNNVHKTLVALNESSLVTRQEFVSMLPPCFLDVQPGDRVLDMCAAPGQKTQQLVQSTGPTGLVVANDADLKRTHTLMHNLIDQPTPHLLITNLDASRLPDFPFKFDKVLADVPCSGDGTLRKAPDVWRTFKVKHGQGLHPLQKQILTRGLQLLKVGGKLVYSTCSMNPLENEAVVSAILQSFGSSVRVVPNATKFASAGFSAWKVLDEDLKIDQNLLPSFYAPTSESVKNQLMQTSRFYPWKTNSGGFYVAIFEKFAELEGPESDELSAKVALYQLKNLSETFVADQQRSMPLHPFERFQDENARAEIKKQFGFSRFFEENDVEEVVGNLANRRSFGVEPSRIYLINKHVNSIFEVEGSNQLYHIVQMGCGAFNKQSGVDRNVIYRIESNVNFLLNHTNRVVKMKYASFLKVLTQGLIEQVGDAPESLTFDQLEDAEFEQHARGLNVVGQVLIQVSDSANCEFLNEFCISGWLGGNSIGIHMKKKGRHALNCLLSGVMITEILVSGHMRRKEAHKEKRKQVRGKGEGEANLNGKKDEE
ncbi:Sun/nucleolar protein family protein [Spironucleus salmonicida]|uniref:Sun/nucleolar protein family protein n=1 Tax=Spironucleus salmonicida TaxID=348837 RepID=V6LR37_9EUKA|nr:Sun/nucleolar protein family protein [Spironucleus salmonicida]|eukprot:EST43224.1 Sun/nucleolar protein family protein [Spironucleus salmonicida]